MPVSVTRSYRPSDPVYNKIQRVLSLVDKEMSMEPKDLLSKELQDLRAAAKKLESIRSQGEEAGKMLSQSSQQNNKMKKIAADRNYRMLKRADIGERILDAPLANPPLMPTKEDIKRGAIEMACRHHGMDKALEMAPQYMEASKEYFMEHGRSYNWGGCGA